MDMRAIDVDFDVHKKIEIERRSFDESDNEVLRRLLGIKVSTTQTAPVRPTGRAWTGKGVTLPSGTELRMQYNGVEAVAEIKNGSWIVEGLSYAGPSPAAAAAATTRRGNTPSLNGWIYWSAKLPGTNSWVPISNLRKR